MRALWQSVSEFGDSFKGSDTTRACTRLKAAVRGRSVAHSLRFMCLPPSHQPPDMITGEDGPSEACCSVTPLFALSAVREKRQKYDAGREGRPHPCRRRSLA